MNRFAVRLFAMPLLLTAIFFLAACGKAGMPVPKKTQDTFTITGAGVTVMGKCLAARGTVTGAVNNFERVMVEVDPIDSHDDCPGCPFNAGESQEFSASDVQFDAKTGQFLLSFCPSTEAPMYRWRLVGKNVHPGLPYATTTPQVVIMNK
ncbi:MAG: hypothetical protein DELT_02146 [Desulfovibrio sp.]